MDCLLVNTESIYYVSVFLTTTATVAISMLVSLYKFDRRIINTAKQRNRKC